MKQKINFRLVFIAILAVLSTAISITFAYYGLFQKQVQKDLRISAQVLKDTRYFETAYGHTPDIDLTNELEDLRVTWVDRDGTVLYDNDTNAGKLSNHKDRPEIRQAFEQGVGESVRKSDTMNMDTFYYAILLDNGTVLRVATQARSFLSVFFTALPTIGLLCALVVVACVILSHMLTGQLIEPIEEMAKNMGDATIEPAYKELRPFADIIRKQHADILSAAKMRQDFTANVSHELKTPLTAISGYAELIENHMVDEEQGMHFIREIRKNAERLLTLINDIIRLSELDRSDDQQAFEELDLKEIVDDGVEGLRISAEKRGVRLYVETENCTIRGNREMTRELVDNLVQNAIRYNNEGGSVWITTGYEDGHPVLTVKDNGIGIPKAEQERVFERFYRVDKSRSKATGGTGLGLAIVKHIVQIHDAAIELTGDEGEGTQIKVRY